MVNFFFFKFYFIVKEQLQKFIEIVNEVEADDEFLDTNNFFVEMNNKFLKNFQ
jgi:hypothetical protein